MEAAAAADAEADLGTSFSSEPLTHPPSSLSESPTPRPRFGYDTDPICSFSGAKRWRAAGRVSGGGGGGGELLLLDDDPDLNYSGESDGEYEKFIQRMNPPRVVVDNEACDNATVIKVDSANKYGNLLEVVQVLSELNLIITKAYVSSDGGWSMKVFNVTDHEGQKLMDESTFNGLVDYIHESLNADYSPLRRGSVDVAPSSAHTLIEITGTDRLGLLSDVSAVLTNFNCDVLNAEVWTHRTRFACVMHITDVATGLAITDAERLSTIKNALCNAGAKMVVSQRVTYTERRLHQMMPADQHYERCNADLKDQNHRPNVTVQNWCQKNYSVVTIQCKDRMKLLFDTVCTLTDMNYEVFHASIHTGGRRAYQEFYIRNINGSPVASEAERQHVIRCLEAAIERRVSEGSILELRTSDRVGLLSDVTRIFRENSLNVMRAVVTTRGGTAIDTFFVQDATGNQVEAGTIDNVRRAIGQSVLQVRGQYELFESPPRESPTRFLFGGLFRSKFRYKFGSASA